MTPLVEDAHTIARAGINLDPIKSSSCLWCRGLWPKLGPEATGHSRWPHRYVIPRRDELLHTLRPERVTEVRVPKLALEAPLLLLFHPPPCLQGKANDGFQVLVLYRHVRIGKEELHQAANGLAYCFNVATA
ncbi:MAG TPA: hypothetical protein VK775_18850 [Chthoniobacterales bacterium]|nr:hypothetical protein [Chthoniobacterales bacterium]